MIKKFLSLKKTKIRDQKIVVIGGGTGLSSLLLGLKKYNDNISAIVNVTDDGGSSGRLSKEFGILPPGDIRNCLVSLAKEENLMSKLFSYRFGGKSEISGHSFGNLFIMAMSEIFGSFEKGLFEAGKILAIKGLVIPATFEKVRLVAKKADGKTVYGETRISACPSKIEEIWLEPNNVRAAQIAINAIKDSDVIIFGPGSFYTSIISNILIEDIRNAVLTSKAVKIFVCNVMSQPGETSGYTSSKYLEILEKYFGKNVIDYILINGKALPQDLLEKYKKANSFLIHDDFVESKTKKIREDLFGEELSTNAKFARHDPKKLARVIKRVIEGKYDRDNSKLS